jgi:ZIP family zinc transporter
MYAYIFIGILLPFIGTLLGASLVFFMKKELGECVGKILSGFAAGVMIAASVWSLLIPAMEYESSQAFGKLSFLPALTGIWIGIGFMFLIERLIPEPSHDESRLKKNMLFWSVTLHNLPEGMAVGVLYAAVLKDNSPNLLSAAFALSIGIAIQNFPEGAIISMPLYSKGIGRTKAFLLGALSGIVEPLGAIITLLAVSFILPLLPALLGFAAGAMIFAVLKELMPSITSKKGATAGIISFAIGFSCMMMLDVALG